MRVPVRDLISLMIIYGVLIASCVFMNACQGPRGPDGYKGSAGTNGSDGSNGANGVDGQSGSNGADGVPGADGHDGVDATPVTIVQLCPGTPSYPSTFIEIGFCLSNKLYATYSTNGGFSTYLPPGGYTSNAVGSSCNFTVVSGCQISW